MCTTYGTVDELVRGARPSARRVFRPLIGKAVVLRSVLLAAGAAALLGIAAFPAPAAAYGCVYTPGGYAGADYYTTTDAGNDPSVNQNGGCDIFDMSRGNLQPSYQYWRGWLYTGSGWYTNGYHYDGTPGIGVLLESDVAATTNEHAQIDGGCCWRNQEYH
jgi:hypothetical protein